MLCAAAGLPTRRADEVLEVVGLVSLCEARLNTLSRGMDRRLGLACALLSDPHTLVLDDPAAGLAVREGRWLHGIMRAHADQGGTVLFTTREPKEAARTADRVLTLEGGRLVADQEVADFSRTRLRPRIAVRTPHAARLGALLTKEARTARRSVEIVREGATGCRCTAVPAPRSARPPSDTASSSTNSRTRSGTWVLRRRCRHRRSKVTRSRPRTLRHRSRRPRGWTRGRTRAGPGSGRGVPSVRRRASGGRGRGRAADAG